ncbi:MAG: Dual specificity protein phosphatase family protein [Nitrospira sp.]|nr:MAG: Dual specificity protein phosphatase family protein [Nitrospira sp.]
MHVISDALILGNIDEARNPMPGIAGLLLVAEEFQVEPPAWLDYEYIPFKEFSAVDPARLDRAVAWLEARAPGTRTLVCCRAGMGRSASVLIAYFCCNQGLSYEDAVAFVKARRPGAMPLPQLQTTIEKVMKLRASRASKNAGSASVPRAL